VYRKRAFCEKIENHCIIFRYKLVFEFATKLMQEQLAKVQLFMGSSVPINRNSKNAPELVALIGMKYRSFLLFWFSFWIPSGISIIESNATPIGLPYQMKSLLLEDPFSSYPIDYWPFNRSWILLFWLSLQYINLSLAKLRGCPMSVNYFCVHSLSNWHTICSLLCISSFTSSFFTSRAFQALHILGCVALIQ
jgi:hypothetical protein